MAKSATELIHECMKTLERDLPKLEKIDRYVRGDQDQPYMPADADAEYRLLAQRCITNVAQFLVSTPAQAMYVDAFRRGSEVDALQGGRRGAYDEIADGDDSKDVGVSIGNTKVSAEAMRRTQAMQPEWIHWQKSRLDARQSAVYRGALTFGHSFVVTLKDKEGQAHSKGLSALKTSAIFDDPATDDTPVMVFHVLKWPTGTGDKFQPGKAVAWDDKNEYDLTFRSLSDKKGITIKGHKPHGVDECPVTRFTAFVDLDGRTEGVVWPMIPLQDRINQTVFDLLVAQTFGSFKVRTITGMAPPMQQTPVWEFPDGDGPEGTINNGKGAVLGYNQVVDPKTGRPVPEDINMSVRRFMFAANPEVKFGAIEGTALGGYLDAIGEGFKNLAALGHIPPHFLLGNIANLSAEAINAAETSLARRVMEFQSSFGESWERVFRIAAFIDDVQESADDWSGEVIWRDLEQRSLSQAGDALGKLSQMLGIPGRGLWPRVPGVTAQEMQTWEELREEEDREMQMANAINAANESPSPTFNQRPPRQPGSTQQQTPKPSPEEGSRLARGV